MPLLPHECGSAGHSVAESQTVEILRDPSPTGYSSTTTVSVPDAIMQPAGLSAASLSLERLFG